MMSFILVAIAMGVIGGIVGSGLEERYRVVYRLIARYEKWRKR